MKSQTHPEGLCPSLAPPQSTGMGGEEGREDEDEDGGGGRREKAKRKIGTTKKRAGFFNTNIVIAP